MEHFKSLRDQVFLTVDVDPKKHVLKFNDYVKYIMQMGSLEEKRDVVLAVDRQLYLHNRSIIVSPIV